MNKEIDLTGEITSPDSIVVKVVPMLNPSIQEVLDKVDLVCEGCDTLVYPFYDFDRDLIPDYSPFYSDIRMSYVIMPLYIGVLFLMMVMGWKYL